MALLEKHDRKLSRRETLDFEVPQVQKKKQPKVQKSTRDQKHLFN